MQINKTYLTTPIKRFFLIAGISSISCLFKLHWHILLPKRDIFYLLLIFQSIVKPFCTLLNRIHILPKAVSSSCFPGNICAAFVHYLCKYSTDTAQIVHRHPRFDKRSNWN